MATIKNPTVPIFYREITSLTIDNSVSNTGASVANRPIHEPFDVNVVKSQLNTFLKSLARTNEDLVDAYGSYFSLARANWRYSFSIHLANGYANVYSANGQEHQTDFENAVSSWGFGYPAVYNQSSASAPYSEQSTCALHPTYITKKIYE